MSSSNTNQNIIPKDCSYGCNTRIYWNIATSEYWEVFSKKKHVCPNRSNNNASYSKTSIPTTKPNYYNKFAKQPKPKKSNLLELLQGSITEVQKKYEILSDLVTEYNGKVHGSQSHVKGNSISLVVYYETPDGKREEVKQKFSNFLARNNIVLQRNY
ncbi:MAG: hypothetical protein ACRD8K_10195 [Nitrososphaeraceae archaeon]